MANENAILAYGVWSRAGDMNSVTLVSPVTHRNRIADNIVMYVVIAGSRSQKSAVRVVPAHSGVVDVIP